MLVTSQACQTGELISSFDSHNVDVTSEDLEAVGSETSQSRYLSSQWSVSRLDHAIDERSRTALSGLHLLPLGPGLPGAEPREERGGGGADPAVS